MKTKRSTRSIISTATAVFAFMFVLVGLGTSHSAGLLQPKNGDESLISIKSHVVEVVINNGFARTTVDQEFVNNGDGELEAVYSFPLPKQASLSELSLWINGREVVGEVLEKQKAENLYESQKSEGKDTALAVKNDYKTFDVQVYPVRTNEPTRVRLVYYQPIEIDLNIGRYVYPLEEGGVDEGRIAFWSVDSEVRESFTFDLVLKSTQPIKDVRLPAHPQAVIERVSDTEETGGGNAHVYHVRLEYPEGGRLDKDIIFYYRLDDSVPARVELVANKEKGAAEGTFMLTITPGASLTRISEGVDWVFVLDKSGSMGGGKIRTLTEGVARVLGKMTPADRFRVVTFNDTAEDMTQGFVPAVPEAVHRVVESVRNISAEGSTALYTGIQMGLEKTEAERTTAIVLVTDGVANVGPQNHADFLKLIEAHDVRLFTFIMGNSANRPLLENVARASGGFALDVSMGDDIYGRLLQAKSKVLFEALHDVEVTFSGGNIVGLTPARPGSLYQGQQLVMFGKYRKPGPVSVSLEAKISGAEHEWACDAALPDEDTENPEIERLWALSAIRDIMMKIEVNGESDTLRGQVVDLGEHYSLVTDYTSMVVLDEQAMEGEGIQRVNGDRVSKERAAQQRRKGGPVKNYRVDKTPDGGMFKGTHPSNVGSGPVGPWFLVILVGCGWLLRRNRSEENRVQ